MSHLHFSLMVAAKTPAPSCGFCDIGEAVLCSLCEKCLIFSHESTNAFHTFYTKLSEGLQSVLWILHAPAISESPSRIWWACLHFLNRITTSRPVKILFFSLFYLRGRSFIHHQPSFFQFLLCYYETNKCRVHSNVLVQQVHQVPWTYLSWAGIYKVELWICENAIGHCAKALVSYQWPTGISIFYLCLNFIPKMQTKPHYICVFIIDQIALFLLKSQVLWTVQKPLKFMSSNGHKQFSPLILRSPVKGHKQWSTRWQTDKHTFIKF